MLILDALASSQTLFVSTAVALGLIVGSFLNVVILRLPVMMQKSWRQQCVEYLELEAEPDEEPAFNLVTPRSRCPGCGRGIMAWQNIPVLSWLALRGRCGACGQSISPRYPIIEALTGVLTGCVAYHFGYGAPAAAGMALTWALIALTWIDLDHQLLPDDITLPFLWLGLALSLVPVFASPADAILGAVGGYGVLWCVFHGFKQLTGKEGMGHGDFKLLAVLGAWFGWKLLPLVIFFASAVAAIVGIALIAFRNHNRQMPIPFGPYLAAAGWLAMLYGHQVMDWYLG